MNIEKINSDLVELAIKTDENDIFIVLCYYFK